MRCLLLSLALALSLPALAADLEPVGGDARLVQLFSPTGEVGHHSLPAGDTIDYNVSGGEKLVVELRRRLDSPDHAPPPAHLLVLGDGHEFLRIEARELADPMVRIDDQLGGTPSLPDVAYVDVPGTGGRLTFQAPDDGPDFLLRIYLDDPDAPKSLMARAPDDAAPPVVTPPPPDTTDLDAVADDSLGADSADDGLADDPDEPSADAPVDSGNQLASAELDDPPEEPEPKQAKKQKAPKKAKPGKDRTQPPVKTAWLRVGVQTGLGAPMRADKSVPFLGVRAEVPTLGDWLDVGLDLGWYRLRVEHESTITDPLLAGASLRSSWRIDTYPVTFDATLRSPWHPGSVRPFAGVGLGVLVARRTDTELNPSTDALDPVDGSATSALAPVMIGRAGATYPLGPGDLSLAATWTAARRDFGNPASGGTTASEDLTNVRADLAWLYRFE